MATNSTTRKTIIIEVIGGQAKASMDGVTLSTKELNEELQSVQTNMKATTDATGGATATVLELGRVVSDSNYGIRGMANNLSQLVSNFTFMTRTVDKTTGAALGFSGALGQIKNALLGPLGIILVFQTVIAIIERFSMKTKEAEEAIEDLNSALKGEIDMLDLHLKAFDESNLSLEAREGLVKSLLDLDKEAAKEYEAANGNLREQRKIIERLLKNKRIELQMKEKEKEITEAQLKLKDVETGAYQSENERRLAVAVQQLEINELFEQYLELRNQIIEQDKDMDKEPEDIDFGDTEGVFWTVEDYDTAMQLDIEQRRRYIESRRLFYDELKIQASEANNDILRDEIQHREDMLVGFKEGSIERLEAEHEISMLRMDLVDREFEHEMLILDLKMQAQMEYVDFLNGMGRVFARIQSDNEKIQQLGLIMQKGAAIAGIVIETSRANQEVLASSVGEIGFYRAAGAARTIIGGPAAAAPFLAMAEAAKASAAKRILLNNVGAGISIANILAANMKSRGGARGLSIGGRETAGEGGGRTFDFNLVGTTGTNQLAEAVGAQFQEPIQAFVVSSQVTSQQELDLEISTGASLGD
jgi:hypothetical protein